MASLKFVDLFAGCGGISLGLTMAGMRGLFAVERDPMAFSTFSANLIEQRHRDLPTFHWPSWLEQRAWDVDDLLTRHADQLSGMRGQVDLLAGGPPCQGFSFAGRRNVDDPRNMLFERYVEVVDRLQPKLLLVENVPGMQVAHRSKASRLEGPKSGPSDSSYFHQLTHRLNTAGYVVEGMLLNASDFGVPQRRSRLIAIGLRNDVAASLPGGLSRVRELVEKARIDQADALMLPTFVSCSEALSDLETVGRKFRSFRDADARGIFSEAVYAGPDTAFQRLMRMPSTSITMNSMRLPRHTAEVSGRFASILAECVRGVTMSASVRSAFGIKKQRIHPLHPDQPAPTVTTLPDDILHYSEPRILTVRECARLQSFPDWFEFRGKYTTGGRLRRKECPRYTQVGNAVPPLMARALGMALRTIFEEAEAATQRHKGKYAA